MSRTSWVMTVGVTVLVAMACIDASKITGTLEIPCDKPIPVVTDPLDTGSFNALCPHYIVDPVTGDTILRGGIPETQ